MEYRQGRNSSTVRVYRVQASSSESRQPRTAATTSALRRITQRFVPGAGRSAIVRGEPSGPMTYLTLGRWGSVIATTLTDSTQLAGPYARRLKIWLSAKGRLLAFVHVPLRRSFRGLRQGLRLGLRRSMMVASAVADD